jgi:hypothetical protein
MEIMMIDIMTTSLLTADQICERLSIARSTFDRLRRLTVIEQFDEASTPKTMASQREDQAARSATTNFTPFPAPALNVLGTPRWTSDTVNKWVDENKDEKSGRGGAFKPRTA